MFPWFAPTPAAHIKPPRVGSHWKKRGETLSWEVVEAEDDRVVLAGPGNCKGRMFLDSKDFHQDFERV